MRSVISTGLALTLLIASASALNAIGIKGQEFVDGTTGARFQLVGIDYQPRGSSGYDPSSHKDALSDADVCRRDAAVMQSIGVNTLRVYNLDPNVNHDDCASIFNAAGIYMVIDVNSPLPNESINKNDPVSSYHLTYLSRTFAMMDNFRNYPNTLAFFSANELIDNVNSTAINPSYIRAVTRDLHQYMRARAGTTGRIVPIGYSAADVRSILTDTTNYISCAIDGESNNESKSDFIGVNGYSWCGDVTDWTVGKYDELAEIYSNTTIPVFFSEYGCNDPQPRHFNEISAIYDGTKMPTFSGGLAYEYSQEDNNFGLTEITSATEIALLDDFATLGSKFAGIDQSYLTRANSSATSISPPKCDKSLISGDFQNSWTLPAQPSGAADLIKNGVSGAIVGKINDDISLELPSDLKATWKGNGSSVSLKLIKKSTSNSLGDTTGASAPGSGAGASASSSTSKAAGDRITPVAQAGIFVAALTYLLGML